MTECIVLHAVCVDKREGLVSIKALVFFLFHTALVLPSGSFVRGLGVFWALDWNTACGAETLSQADRCLGTALFPAVRFQSRIKKSLNTFVSQIKDSYLSVRGESTARLIWTADSTPHWTKPGPLRTNLYCLIYDIGHWYTTDKLILWFSFRIMMPFV